MNVWQRLVVTAQDNTPCEEPCGHSRKRHSMNGKACRDCHCAGFKASDVRKEISDAG